MQAGGPLRVLLVDDDDAFRAALRELCSVLPGLEVVGAAAGVDEALAIRARTAVDVVVADIRMPHGGGRRLLHALRADGHRGRVVLTSAGAPAALVDTLLSEGADAFVPKSAPALEWQRTLCPT
ncbi:MAG: response regulator transcription factor [Acidimicrobiales bacterium]|nr:response regulator transcription factor [Acidimicrobiales bacterium]